MIPCLSSQNFIRLKKLNDSRPFAFEVFFPKTGRLARLPLVDVGPGTTGPAKTAIADLTVAAAAFLQTLTEKDMKKLDNIEVSARIVA